MRVVDAGKMLAAPPRSIFTCSLSNILMPISSNAGTMQIVS
jgi:hypothetical protein